MDLSGSGEGSWRMFCGRVERGGTQVGSGWLRGRSSGSLFSGSARARSRCFNLESRLNVPAHNPTPPAPRTPKFEPALPPRLQAPTAPIPQLPSLKICACGGAPTSYVRSFPPSAVPSTNKQFPVSNKNSPPKTGIPFPHSYAPALRSWHSLTDGIVMIGSSKKWRGLCEQQASC